MIILLIVRVSINGSVSVNGNAATITLNNNFDGVFQCRLDGGSFQNCMIYNYFVLLVVPSVLCSKVNQEMYFLDYQLVHIP